MLLLSGTLLALLPTLSYGAPTDLQARDGSSVCTYHVAFSSDGYPYINSYDITLSLFAPRTNPQDQGKKLAFAPGIIPHNHWGPNLDSPSQYCWLAKGLNENFCITPTAPYNMVATNWTLSFEIGNVEGFSSPTPNECSPPNRKRHGASVPGPHGMSVGCVDDGEDISIDGSFDCTGTFA